MKFRQRGALSFLVFEMELAIEFDAILAGAHVAQLVEHILGKDEVISSILIMGSTVSEPIQNRNI